MSVQLDDSKMWSLLDINNGEMVFTDEFFAPATNIVNGAFFMQADNGTFDVYTISDTKNKLNRDSYTFVSNFNKNGYAIVRVKTEPWQIIDTKGATVATLDKNINIKGGFSDDGLALLVNKDGLYGYVDEKGQTAIAPKYKAARAYCDGAAVVLTKTEDGKSYFEVIDSKGEVMFKFNTGQYSNISDFNEGHAFAVEGDHVVLLDKQGKKVAAVGNGTDLTRLSYSDGKFIYSDGEFYGVKDVEGNILLRAKYGSLQFISKDKLLAVSSSRKYGVVNTNDDVILPFEYDDLIALDSDRFLTNSGSLKVLINDKGKDVCKQAFKNVVNRNESENQNAQTAIISSENNNASFDFDKSMNLEAMINSSFDGFGYDMSRYGAVEEDEVMEPHIAGATMHFEGAVGDYPVEVTLTFDSNGQVSGVYKYTRTGNGDSMALDGTYTLTSQYQAQVTLQERYNGTVSATWTLDVVNGGDPMANGNVVTSAGKNFKVRLEMPL